MNMSISGRIKALRKEMGMTQEQLGKKAGVSKNAVSLWERGETTPERDALMNLERNARVNPEWIIRGKGQMFLSSGAPYASSSPVPPMRRLPVFSWEEAGRDDREKGENYMGVPFEVGPNAFILAVENDAMGDIYPRGGFVIVDPDADAKSGKIVVAVADGATIPILRKLVIEGGENRLVPSVRGYDDPRKAARIIGPVVGYWRLPPE